MVDQSPVPRQNVLLNDLPQDLLIYMASFLPSQDIDTFATTVSALDPLDQETAITYEDRNPTLNKFGDFQFAKTKGWNDVLNQLIVNKHVVPQALFEWAWTNECPRILEALYAINPRNPTLNNYADFQYAETKGWDVILNQLIVNQHVVPQALFDWAWTNNHPMTLGALLAIHPLGFDPTVDNNKAIRSASNCGHLEVVQLLLNDRRVNPAADDNFAIRWASHNGDHKIVRLLLKDERVNPAARDNEAIRWASKYRSTGHHEVIRLLLNDERVDPADSSLKLVIQPASLMGHHFSNIISKHIKHKSLSKPKSS